MARPRKCSQGEQLPQSKLTNEDVAIIRQLRKHGLQLKHIAEKFEVSEKCICQVVNFSTWKHVL
jgi:DNA-binding NarL/FixJ family response regulator